MLDRRTLLKLIASGTAFTAVSPQVVLAKTSGKHYAMVFDVRRCTGCLSCTVNCSIENQTDPGRERTVVNQLSLKKRRRRCHDRASQSMQPLRESDLRKSLSGQGNLQAS